jgi:hypothetical protein
MSLGAGGSGYTVEFVFYVEGEQEQEQEQAQFWRVLSSQTQRYVVGHVVGVVVVGGGCCCC